jgi:hypothetical protein
MFFILYYCQQPPAKAGGLQRQIFYDKIIIGENKYGARAL